MLWMLILGELPSEWDKPCQILYFEKAGRQAQSRPKAKSQTGLDVDPDTRRPMEDDHRRICPTTGVDPDFLPHLTLGILIGRAPKNASFDTDTLTLCGQLN